MIIFEHTDIVGFEPAIRGMRNPMNSWEKSDSWFYYCDETEYGEFSGNFTVRNINDNFDTYEGYSWEETADNECLIGPNDHKLMMQLAKAGTTHSKYRRMINVYVDITAPLYWWKEFDTYKVGTVANSCSTMHKISAKKFELKDFSTDHMMQSTIDTLKETIYMMNVFRERFIATDDGKSVKKDFWWQMIQLLPSSYNQKRTVMLNYEVLAGIYPNRKNHKLDEWRNFCAWIKSLPYNELITLEEDSK